MIVRTIIVVVVVVLGASHPEPRIFLPVFYIVYFESYIPTHFHSKDRMILYCTGREGDHLFFSPKKESFYFGPKFLDKILHTVWYCLCHDMCIFSFFSYSIIFQNYGNIYCQQISLFLCMSPSDKVDRRKFK